MAAAVATCACSTRLPHELEVALKTVNSYVVEKAVPADAGAISRCVRTAFHKGDIFRMDGPAGCERTSEEEVSGQFKDKTHTWLVIRPLSTQHKTEVVGAMLYISSPKDKHCSLEMLSVNPTLKGNKPEGKTFGERLLENAFTLAQSEKKERILIDVVDVNPKLKDWYKKFGFVRTHTLPSEFCTDFQHVLKPEWRGGKIKCVEMEKVLVTTTAAKANAAVAKK